MLLLLLLLPLLFCCGDSAAATLPPAAGVCAVLPAHAHVLQGHQVPPVQDRGQAGVYWGGVSQHAWGFVTNALGMSSLHGVVSKGEKACNVARVLCQLIRHIRLDQTGAWCSSCQQCWQAPADHSSNANSGSLDDAFSLLLWVHLC
jgi:hypothetical protein